MTSNDLDTVDALMAHYAAGILPEPARVLVAAHLEMQSAHRPMVAAFEAAAGDLIETIEPMSLEQPDRTLQAIYETGAGRIPLPGLPEPPLAPQALPRAIRDLVGCDAPDIPWRRKLPGLKEHSLGKIDGCDVTLFWIRPGRAVPEHTHHGFELSLVLHGAFHDGRARFARGDISVADDGVDHRPVADGEEPCIVFAVTDAPLKLKGSLRRLLGDLIG